METHAQEPSRTEPRAQGREAGATPAEAVTTEERRRIIAEAAYFRAERRGFRGGDPLEDWLAAEAEVERMLDTGRGQREEELSAYKKVYGRVRHRLEKAQGRIHAETLKKALEHATAEVKEAGEHAASTVNKVARAVRKDMASAADRLGPRWEQLSEKTSGVFAVWRDRSTKFLEQAAEGTRDWLKGMRGKKQRHLYEADEMTDAGTFKCTACGHHVVLSGPEHLQPCPECGGKEFERL